MDLAVPEVLLDPIRGSDRRCRRLGSFFGEFFGRVHDEGMHQGVNSIAHLFLLSSFFDCLLLGNRTDTLRGYIHGSSGVYEDRRWAGPPAGRHLCTSIETSKRFELIFHFCKMGLDWSCRVIRRGTGFREDHAMMGVITGRAPPSHESIRNNPRRARLPSLRPTIWSLHSDRRGGGGDGTAWVARGHALHQG